MRIEPRAGFVRLWSAYAVSTYGTWIAFGAFPLIAVRVLHSPTFGVALLESAGPAVAAVVALGLGPWIEHRAKRPVMIAMDLLRFLAMAGVPLAYLCGFLSYGQLLAVSVVSGTAGIAFTAASGAYLKHLVREEHLLAANGRFEATMWSATAVGPPLGGALIGMLGPVVTIAADAVSYLLSALGVLRIRGTDIAALREPNGSRNPDSEHRMAELLAGWRFILGDPFLRRLFLNSVTVSGLIMATQPTLTVLLLGRYHFPAWQYGLAFGLPAAGGLLGARLSARLVARYGRGRVLLVTGWLRSLFPIGLAFTGPGIPGLVTVILVEGLLITCMGIFTPSYTTERLQRTPADRTARVLASWSVSGKLSQAGLMAVWGELATLTSARTAIIASGVLLLATPLLLPRKQERTEPAPV
ncbi:MFS transporter [Sciscionella marina]|uniref:MFS transporter n=1 Tax=Sciscionella marina TaxID=508770 RepID=UPI000382AA82|nr:MFS transporter [Sciscionella marina]